MKPPGTRLTELRTVEAERAPLRGGRVRRRPERAEPAEATEGEREAPPEPEEPQPEAVAPGEHREHVPEAEPETETEGPAGALGQPAFAPPILGWDTATGEAVRWHATGEGALPNGHVGDLGLIRSRQDRARARR